MRLFTLSYTDKLFPEERYNCTNRYTMPEAKEMSGMLKTMGCRDFEYHPVDIEAEINERNVLTSSEKVV